MGSNLPGKERGAGSDPTDSPLCYGPVLSKWVNYFFITFIDFLCCFPMFCIIPSSGMNSGMSEVAFFKPKQSWSKEREKLTEVKRSWSERKPSSHNRSLMFWRYIFFVCPFVKCLVIKVAFGLFLLFLAYWGVLGHFRLLWGN